jgi:hypothetical protein
MTTYGDNAFAPGAVSDTYVPDQLIAGNLKLVTDTVTIGSGQVLKRGSVLGRAAFGSLSASAGTANASGTILVAAAPAAGDTLTVQGTAITFVAQNPVGNQVAIGPSGTQVALTAAQVAAALAAFLIGSTDTNISKMTYTLSGSTITATAVAAGTGGNAYTLATSNSTAFTLSGATLSGGVANTGNATVGSMSLGPNFKAGPYVAVCLTATTAQVSDPGGSIIGTATFGTPFKDAQVNFTITAGGTPCVAGDAFVLNAARSSGYFLATAAATDGSKTPVSILADDIDTTAGALSGGVYQMGEFNGNKLILGAGITLAAAKDALRPLGIFVKSSLTADDPS